MPLLVELTPDVEDRLQSEARRQGIAPSEFARRLIENALPSASGDEATLKLLAEWEERDATDDPQEIARRNQEFEEFRSAINQTRDQAGARKIYP